MAEKGFTHESSRNKSIEWYTPRYIFECLGIGFDLDPCSPGGDVVPWVPAKEHLTIEQDGLLLPWRGNVWMNPPYGKNTPVWLERLSLHGTGIALLFVRPDTQWFQKYAVLSDAICFIKGRVGFVRGDKAKDYAACTFEPSGGCGAASMLIAYGKANAAALSESGLGLTVFLGGK